MFNVSRPMYIILNTFHGQDKYSLETLVYAKHIEFNAPLLYALLILLFHLTTACNNGDIRLFGGQNELEGTVELCLEGTWGSVCDDGWGYYEARVACRNLGFSTQGD